MVKPFYRLDEVARRQVSRGASWESKLTAQRKQILEDQASPFSQPCSRHPNALSYVISRLCLKRSSQPLDSFSHHPSSTALPLCLLVQNPLSTTCPAQTPSYSYSRCLSVSPSLSTTRIRRGDRVLKLRHSLQVSPTDQTEKPVRPTLIISQRYPQDRLGGHLPSPRSLP